MEAFSFYEINAKLQATITHKILMNVFVTITECTVSCLFQNNVEKYMVDQIQIYGAFF